MSRFAREQVRLIERSLSKIAESSFFNSDIEVFSTDLQNVLVKLRKIDPDFASPLASRIVQQTWVALRFLGGSTSNLIPYEIVSMLQIAASPWEEQPIAITTALIDDNNFYFFSVEEDFYNLAKQFLGIEFQVHVVQIALPRLYRHEPTHWIPLYHELGHYIEHRLALADYLLILHNKNQLVIPNVPDSSATLTDDQLNQIRSNHLKEYFSDLFAACFVGTTIYEYMAEVFGDNPTSITHPSSQNRRQIVDDFLNGHDNAIVDGFNEALKVVDKPILKPRYVELDLSASFANQIPYTISDEEELFGMHQSSWALGEIAHKRGSVPWSALDEDEIDRIIGNLFEKTVRNYFLRKQWTDAASI